MTDLYQSTLEARARAWIALHGDEYRLIRESVIAEQRMTGKPLPEKGTVTRAAIDAAILDAVRRRMGFPSERRWESGERLPI